jgi:hypothetical protein
VSDQPTLNTPGPVLAAELFPEILNELLGLLSGLGDEGWDVPTVCTGWSVKDVASHLLEVEIGNLASRCDHIGEGGALAVRKVDLPRFWLPGSHALWQDQE